MRQLIGKILNYLGLPGFVHSGRFKAPVSGVDVQVNQTALFTIVTVQGTDVYLDRITGDIRGIGSNPAGASQPGFIELNNKGGLRESLRSAAARGRQLQHSA